MQKNKPGMPPAEAGLNAPPATIDMIGLLHEMGQQQVARRRLPLTVADKINQMSELLQHSLIDVTARINLFRQMYHQFPEGVLRDLENKMKETLTSTISFYITDYCRIGGRLGNLRQLYMSDWEAVVFYHYTPGQEPVYPEAPGEPGTPGIPEEIRITGIFVKGHDLHKLLPAHCLDEITETISLHENN